MRLTPQMLVNKSLTLATPPAIYMKVDSLIADPDASIQDIGEVIQSDPALSARLLKIVNTPYYGYPSQIDSISRAITIIGTRELKMMVLAACVVDSFHGIPSKMVDMDSFWRHSLACALAAGSLAELTNYPDTQQAFVAGLLHDIGYLVMCQGVPDLALRAIEASNEKPLHEAEQEIIGFDHGEVGSALIQCWGLPDTLAHVTRYHHRPTEASEQQTAIMLITLANAIATVVLEGQDTPELAIDDAYLLQSLNLTADMLSPILEKVADSLTAMNYH